MIAFVEADDFSVRLRGAVSTAWNAYTRKVAGGTIPASREASMQLHFASILNQLLPMTVQRPDEAVTVELERDVVVDGGIKRIDIYVEGKSDAGPCRIAIELKAYKTFTVHGTRRGAGDLWRLDVYHDLHALERYVDLGLVEQGVLLAMTDYANFIRPLNATLPNWVYNTSQGHRTAPGSRLDRPIANRTPDFTLNREHHFDWQNHGGWFFAEIEGR